ncbi:MAG: Lrp/AsnC family transcriptional regulator [Novosphingobium sp.]
MAEIMKLDRIDINILAEMQKDGRLTNSDLADRVHLSASPCLMRVRKLHNAGLIRSIEAHINLSGMANILTVLTEVTLNRHKPQDLARFVDALTEIENVVECHFVSSGYDYMVKFITSGITEYQEIMENILDMNLGLKRYFSYVVFKTPIMPRQVPVLAVYRKSEQCESDK